MTDLTSPPLPDLASLGRRFGVNLSSAQVDQFAAYSRLLLDWNERVNLTAITDPAEVIVKHFLDSLACLSLLLPAHQADRPVRLLDVGSGAGFPGLALKLARPEIVLTLLDSVGKKTAFLDHAASELGLADVEVLTGRAEEVGVHPRYRETFDVVTSRAVAELAVLVELCLPCLRVGGLMIAQKKAGIEDELRAAGRAVQVLGGRLRPVIEYELPGAPDPRWLIAIEKVAPTSARYPRRVGVPAKKPLCPSVNASCSASFILYCSSSLPRLVFRRG